MYGNDDDHDFEINEVQTGRGQKRKNESDQESESEDEQSKDEQGQYYYQLESRRKYHSKKFGMTATNHRVRFNNVLADRDLLESYETTHKIFHHLLEDVKEGMAPNDQVRFIHRYRRHRSPTRPNQRSKLKNPRWRLKRAKSSSDLSNLGKYGRFLALIVGNRQQICPLFWFY